jgi:nitroreductase
MNVTEAIIERRSIKSFDPTHRMTEQEIAKLMSLAMLSPTAFNIQHWRFVLVTDPVLRQQIRAVSWNQAQVEEASLLIILTADLKAWEKNPARYWANAPQAAQDYLVPAIGQLLFKVTSKRNAMKACAHVAWQHKPLCWPPKKWAMTLAPWMVLILMLWLN